MKKIKLLIMLIIMMFAIENMMASHYAGSELTYTCLGGSNYKITFVFYRDCSGVQAPASIIVNIECSSNSYLNFTTTLNALSYTGQEISKPCATNPTKCSGGNNFGIQEYVYQGTAIIVPCNHWTISYSSCCRNPISTVSGNGGWYTKAMLNNLQGPLSSAPVFIQKPIITVYNGNTYNMNLGALDPDGDSLAFSLYAPFTDSSSSVVYVSGYSAANFLTSSIPITLDSQTGVVSFNPSSNIVTVVGIKVEKWRTVNGSPALIGVIYRDVELKVITGSNHVPALSGMDFSNSHSFSAADTIYSKEVCVGDIMDFDINSYDADSATTAAGKMNISWNQGISGASLAMHNNGTDSAYAHFHWTASNSGNMPLQCFSALVQDGGCPYNASRAYTYCFRLKDTVLIVLNATDTTLCTGDSLSLTAQSSLVSPTYVWRMNGQLLPGISGANLIINTNSYPTGTDTFTIALQGGSQQSCVNGDSIIVNHVYQPHVFGLLPDSVFLSGYSVVYDAGQGMSYKWMDVQNAIIGTSQTQTFDSSGQYHVVVDGGNNTRCTDADTFNLQVIGGIKNIDNKPDFVIIPNPNNGNFILKIENDNLDSKECFIQIFSQDGKLVYSDVVRKLKGKEVEIKLDNPLSGVYYIVVTGNDSELKGRFLIY